MNRNGFTLVELIAVIVILGLLALIANSSVINVVKNSKSDLYNTQLKLIESAAESWGNDNLDKLPNDGECKYLTLANLKNYGLMDEEIINPKTNKEFSDDLYIKITSKINSSGVLKTTYKVDDGVNGCTEALPPVCTLALDSEKTGTELGAKYNCKVKDEMGADYPNGYTFYVLGKNEDGTINLIMNSNINSDGTPVTEALLYTGSGIYNLVPWINKTDYELLGGNTWETTQNLSIYGPVTSMNFLQIATNKWTNINEITINSFDSYEENYNFVSTNKMKEYNIRARMPYLNEVGNFNETNGYLYENLDGEYWGYDNGKPESNISGISGYWILASTANLRNAESWFLSSDGFLFYHGFVGSENMGVRPVITLHDYQIR